MNAAPTPASAAKAGGTVARRARSSVPLAPGSTRDAKRLAAVILEVFAGLRTPQQAADALAMSLGGYYQLEARAMQGLLDACEPKPKGRQADPDRELTVIRRENERLRRDLGRQSRRAGIGAGDATDHRFEPAAAQTGRQDVGQEDTEAQASGARLGIGHALAAGSRRSRAERAATNIGCSINSLMVNLGLRISIEIRNLL